MTTEYIKASHRRNNESIILTNKLKIANIISQFDNDIQKIPADILDEINFMENENARLATLEPIGIWYTTIIERTEPILKNNAGRPFYNLMNIPFTDDTSGRRYFAIYRFQSGRWQYRGYSNIEVAI